MQIRRVRSDQELRDIFVCYEFSALLVETGYRKAYVSVTLSDRQDLLLTLRQYHTMIRGQVELDQCLDGLREFGILGVI